MSKKRCKACKEVQVNPTVTDKEIVAACVAYHKKAGRWPSAKSGDASKLFKFPITWGGIDRRVGSIHGFMVKQGLKEKSRELSDETILLACLAYRAAHGVFPTKDRGDATQWFGFHITWMGIDFRTGSLSRFMVNHGLKGKTATNRPITVAPEEKIKAACLAYYKEMGQWPHARSGDASKWLGFQIDWSGINLRVGGLPKFLFKQGLKASFDPIPLTDEEIIAACLAYRKEMGRLPSAERGDASKWVGFKITWMGIEARVGSLAKFMTRHGLRTPEGAYSAP